MLVRRGMLKQTVNAWGNNYDKAKQSTRISYVGADDVYGFAAVQPLPRKALKFETVNPATLESLEPEAATPLKSAGKEP